MQLYAYTDRVHPLHGMDLILNFKINQSRIEVNILETT